MFNNKEILIYAKPFFIKEWFAKGIVLIKDLLQDFLLTKSSKESIGLKPTS